MSMCPECDGDDGLVTGEPACRVNDNLFEKGNIRIRVTCRERRERGERPFFPASIFELEPSRYTPESLC